MSVIIVYKVYLLFSNLVQRHVPN